MPNAAQSRLEPASDDAATPERMALARQILGQALAHVRGGQWGQAIEWLTSQDEAALVDATACNILGLLYANGGRSEQSLTCFDRALRIEPRMPEALGNRATTLQQLGRLEEAVAAYDDQLAANPADAGAHYNRATALHGLGLADAALAGFDAALAIRPTYPEALANRGLLLQTKRQWSGALIAYEQALALKPDDPTTLYNRGHIFGQLGDFEAALGSYRQALAIDPHYGAALCGAAFALQKLKRLDQALACCDAVLKRDIRCFDALFHRGNILHELHHYDFALACFDAALSVRPDDANAWCNRGATLAELQRNELALASYDQALRLKNPFPEAFSLRGSLLRAMRRLEEALASLDAALVQKPDFAEALCTRGVTLKDLGRIEEAIAAFDAALTIEPGQPHAMNNKGAALLLKGDFAAGWEAYESRWRAENLPSNALPRIWPEWRHGLPLEGKRLLVLDEQGFGDVIQFARYLPMLTDAGAQVTFQCRATMHRLLKTLPSAPRLIETPASEDVFDYEIPLVSLPRAFRTDADSIPAPIPYLRSEPRRAARWGDRLGTQGFRVGVCWQGNPSPRADVARAVPLAHFASLAAVSGVRLVSLQRRFGEEQLAAHKNLRIEDLGPDFDSGPDAFLDAAAVIQNLDLVVTCDTSIAHLAGALGRPVWVALKTVPDWRFQLSGDRSPWYPSMRLFRQKRRGDWAAVFQDIGKALVLFQKTQESRGPQ